MTKIVLYEERVSSTKTQVLFWGLTAFFSMLLAWRISSHHMDPLAAVLLLLALLFLFYSLNYRLLVIRITSQGLRLQFGIFTWTIPPDNIAGLALDDNLPPLAKYVGAGIHFMMFRGRYRASFNFLEFPRVVVALKRSCVVRDLSFSTNHPSEVIQHIRDMTSAYGGA